MNKRITTVILVILLFAFAVCGCTGKDETQTIEGIFIDHGEWGFLVRDTSDGEPYVFSYAMGTDVTEFKEGDKIVVVSMRTESDRIFVFRTVRHTELRIECN